MLQFNWNRPPLPCPTSGKYRCVSSVSVDVLAYRFNTGHIHHAKCLETSETGSCSVSGNTEMLVAQWVSSDPGDTYVRHCGGSLSVQIMMAMCRILPNLMPTHFQLNAKEQTVVQNTSLNNLETSPTSRTHKPLNQWQCSFHLRAALSLGKRFATKIAMVMPSRQGHHYSV